MRKVTYYCNRCGKEIEGNPIKIIAEAVDRETEDFVEEIPEQFEPIREKHFCVSCTEKVIAAAQGLFVKKDFDDVFNVPGEPDMTNEKQVTNADRIRFMSDEELAEIIMCPYEYEGKEEKCKALDTNDVTESVCVTCCLEWLRQSKQKVGEEQ